MPSLLHEAFLLLLRNQPALAVNLLSALGVVVPGHRAVEIVSSDLSQALPVEARADAVVVLHAGPGGRGPVLAIVVEVQRNRDPRKHRIWPLYQAAAAARFGCAACVLVIAPDAGVAAWAARPIEVGPGGWMRPFVAGPDAVPVVKDEVTVAATPELAVLSALVHSSDDALAMPMLRLILTTLGPVGSETSLLYCDLVWNFVSDAVRAALEELMQDLNLPLKNPIRRALEASRAEGEALGRAEGEAAALLLVLGARGFVVSQLHRQRVLACSDLTTLGRWIEVAATAASIDEVFGGQAGE